MGPEQPGQTDTWAPGRLDVTSVAIADPGDLASLLPDRESLAWIRRGEGLVGWGTAAAITLPAGHDRFAAGEKWLRDLFDTARVTDEVSLPGTGPVAFGSFTFDPASDGSVLVVPAVIVGRHGGTAWMTTIEADAEPGRAPTEALRPREQRPATSPGPVRWSDGHLTPPQWERTVAAAVSAITAGQLRKIVLALDLNATAPEEFDDRVLLARLADRYPDCYTFACAGLVGASPELLIRRSGLCVQSLVLAGTTPRGGTAAADDALGAALLASAKDQDEHRYAVDDVRAALRPLCADLRVEDRPSLLRLANVQHLATEVHGQLDEGEARTQSALALAAALHPTAAVCGTPAETAMDLIRDLEGMDRGRYGGPVGWVDARGNGEWAIALRCAELTGNQARLFAGCGIVAGSDPEAELAEAQAKFWPMRYAVEG